MVDLDTYREQVRAERAARLEREIEHEAQQRFNAELERERFAAVAAEVGLGPDAAPSEITRLHRLRQDQFWSDFVAHSPSSFHVRMRDLAVRLGFDPDLVNPADRHLPGYIGADPQTTIWLAMRDANHPETKRPIRSVDAVVTAP